MVAANERLGSKFVLSIIVDPSITCFVTLNVEIPVTINPAPSKAALMISKIVPGLMPSVKVVRYHILRRPQLV